MPRQFSCTECQKRITTYLMIGESVICKSCGTSSVVPVDAIEKKNLNSIDDPLHLNKKRRLPRSEPLRNSDVMEGKNSSDSSNSSESGINDTSVSRQFRCAKCRRMITTHMTAGESIICEKCGYNDIVPRGAKEKKDPVSMDNPLHPNGKDRIYQSGALQNHLGENSSNVSTGHSDIDTIKNELADRGKASLYSILGSVLIPIGILLAIKVAAFFLLLIGIGVVLIGISANMWVKATHVAWVREALRREATRQEEMSETTEVNWEGGVLTTAIDEHKDKTRATGYKILAVMFIVLGINLIIKVHWSFLILVLLGLVIFGLGNKIAMKARFVAWTREGIRREGIVVRSRNPVPKQDLGEVSCSNCGNKQKKGKEFCSNCGIHFGWSHDEREPEEV